jgi:zinc transporter 5/7
VNDDVLCYGCVESVNSFSTSSDCPAPCRYTFGYGRYEVISGFTNGILLVFVSLMVLGEGLGRLVGNPEIETEHLTAVAVAGFCVNLIGLCIELIT